MLPLRDYPFTTRPMIIAHRGDTSRGARENTIEAIEAAIASGADMVEVDVQWSSDHVFVCYHDESAQGMTGEIARTDFAELQKAGIASLEHILRAAQGKLYFNLEVKEYSARDPKSFMQALIALVTKMGVQDHALISSFRMDYLREAGWTVPTVVIHPDDSMQAFFDSRACGKTIAVEKPLTQY